MGLTRASLLLRAPSACAGSPMSAACFPALDYGTRAGSVLGLVGMKFEVVVASLAIDEPGFSWVMAICLVPCCFCGLWGCWNGREKYQCLCRTTVTPAGAVTFLKASSRPFRHASS